MIVLEKESTIISLSFEEIQTLIGALEEASKQEKGHDHVRVKALEGSFSLLLRDLREKFDY